MTRNFLNLMHISIITALITIHRFQLLNFNWNKLSLGGLLDWQLSWKIQVRSVHFSRRKWQGWVPHTCTSQHEFLHHRNSQFFGFLSTFLDSPFEEGVDSPDEASKEKENLIHFIIKMKIKGQEMTKNTHCSTLTALTTDCRAESIASWYDGAFWKSCVHSVSWFVTGT